MHIAQFLKKLKSLSFLDKMFWKSFKIGLQFGIWPWNNAKILWNFTTWWKKMLFYRRTSFYKGGWIFTPPRGISVKNNVGSRRDIWELKWGISKIFHGAIFEKSQFFIKILNFTKIRTRYLQIMRSTRYPFSHGGERISPIKNLDT